jgi:hypothetical protein
VLDQLEDAATIAPVVVAVTGGGVGGYQATQAIVTQFESLIAPLYSPIPSPNPTDLRGAQLRDNYEAGQNLLAVSAAAGAVAFGGIVGSARTAAAKAGYSVAAEVELPVAAWGRSAAVHENVANALLHDRLLTDTGYRAVMEELIPGVTEDVSSAGGRTTPDGWIWHHEQASGLMRLVPEFQHTAGSEFWGALHPGGYGGYASWARAFGAPPR